MLKTVVNSVQSKFFPKNIYIINYMWIIFTINYICDNITGNLSGKK